MRAQCDKGAFGRIYTNVNYCRGDYTALRLRRSGFKREFDIRMRQKRNRGLLSNMVLSFQVIAQNQRCVSCHSMESLLTHLSPSQFFPLEF